MEASDSEFSFNPKSSSTFYVLGSIHIEVELALFVPVFVHRANLHSYVFAAIGGTGFPDHSDMGVLFIS